jgi:hypothetical protein
MATKKEINLLSCSLAVGCERLWFIIFFFDVEYISFDSSLVIYTNSTNIPPIMIINRTLYSISQRNNKKEQQYLFSRFAKPQVEMQTSFD